MRSLVEFNLGTSPGDAFLELEGKTSYGPPSNDEPIEEVTGQVKLRRDSCRDGSLFENDTLLRWGNGDVKGLYLTATIRKIVNWERREVVLDAWGQPIYYRCPGPVHKNGWDLISCGPNGLYEEGGGDDLVVGAELPGGVPREAPAGVTSSSR